jgi:hypothetical protein
MPVHFPSEASPLAETAHGRSNGRALASVRLGFHFSRRETGAGHDFTGLAAAVQLRHRVASGLQTLIVKSRLLTGENSVRIRGDPPIQTRSAEHETWNSSRLAVVRWYLFRAPRSEFRVQRGIRGEIMIILRFERRVCRWVCFSRKRTSFPGELMARAGAQSCRMHQFMPR